jgi:anti-sigma B factor antagonist
VERALAGLDRHGGGVGADPAVVTGKDNGGVCGGWANVSEGSYQQSLARRRLFVHAVWTLPFASSWEAGASMSTTVVPHPARAAVVLGGEIDFSTCPGIRRCLMAAISGGNVHLAVDMSGVTFIDAAGIGVLVAAANRAREAGGGLSLVAPSRQVQRLLDVFHLDAILPAAQRSPGPFVAGSAA